MHTAEQMRDRLMGYCDHPRQDLWHCIDYEYMPSLWSVLSQIVSRKGIELCLDGLGNHGGELAHSYMDQVVQHCSSRTPHLHRIRSDWYWRTNVVQLVQRINQHRHQ
jgi:hypothetical protein